MRDDLPDATLKMALSNGMSGTRRERVPALVARNPVLMHRLSTIVAEPITRENWGSLVELHESACAIVAARNAADAIAAMLAMEQKNGD